MQSKGKGKGGGKRRGRPRCPKGRPLPRRKRGRDSDAENEALLNMLKPSDQDVMKLLAASAHIGRRKAHVNMKRYIWKRRQDGLHVINLEKTWAKLILAARILVTVRNPSDIFIMSTRTYGQRGAIKFAHYTGATALVGKWVPGTFTNPQNKAFVEPRLLIVDDPSTCFAALRETSYCGIPVVALTGTDNNLRFVDCGIPCNNRGKFSVGLMFWLLARELLRMRGDPQCVRKVPWKESVDLFFHRDADEIKRQQDAKQKKAQKAQQALQGYAPNAGANEEVDQYDDGYDGQQQGGQGQGQQAQGGYGGQAQQQGQGQDGGYGGQQQQPMGDDGYGQAQPQGGQDNWDMPQGQDIEDWDQPQGGQGDAQPQQQQQQMQQQGGYEQQGQVQQQQQQQGQQEVGGYDQQQQQQQQAPQQGGYQPQYGDQDGGMGMQTW